MGHSLRWVVIHNLRRTDVPEWVAMTISRHKTRAVFEQYNVASERNLKDVPQAR